MDFEKRFRDAVKPHHRTHVILEEYSRSGRAAISETDLVEAASFALLLKNATDTHSLDRLRLSDTNKRPAEDVLTEESVVVSAVGMSRNDIAPLETVKRSAHGPYQFKMTEKNGFVTPEVNYDADNEKRFSRAGWVSERLNALDVALSQGAQIITFGETDFPPLGTNLEEESYLTKLQARIDAVERPVFLVAGTRHDHFEHSECHNRARILVNSALQSLKRTDLENGPILHSKLYSAERAGEKISVPTRPRVRYYETVLGNIAVLICVDAYSPAVLMSALASRAIRGRDQIDFILVPSYNESPKLYYSCQVLSLLSGSVVVLADACSQRNDKPAETAIFIGGRLFSDLLDDRNSDLVPCGEFISSAPHKPVRSCKLSLDYLREVRAREQAVTPFVNTVSQAFMRHDLRAF